MYTVCVCVLVFGCGYVHPCVNKHLEITSKKSQNKIPIEFPLKITIGSSLHHHKSSLSPPDTGGAAGSSRLWSLRLWTRRSPRP